MSSVRDLLQSSSEREHPAFVIHTVAYGYDELRARARQLPQLGTGPLVPVALVARPKLSHLLVLLAALEQGVPLLLLHPRASAASRERLVHFVGATRLYDGLEPQVVPVAPQYAQQGDQLLIPTSGSTGSPRIAVFGKRQFAAAAEASQGRLPLGPGCRWALTLPYSHVGGLSIVTRCLLAQATVVVAEADLGASSGWAELDSTGVTHASLVPTQLQRALEAGATPPASLKEVLVGGAPCPTDLRRQARESGWPVRFTYGLTEACSQVATQQGGLGPDVDERDCGTPLPGVSVRLGPAGQISVASPALMTRYWGKEPLAPGSYFETSDWGSWDHANRLVIQGRRDNLIISGGENIAPETIEGELLTVPGVREACVVGVPDERWGQKVVAILAGDSEQEEKVRARTVERLDGYARPKDFLWRAELPQLPGGKLDRAAVLGWAQAQLSEPDS